MSIALQKFLYYVHHTPDAPALRARNKTFTYGQLALTTANILKRLQTGNNLLIGIVTNDDVYTYAAILAILFKRTAYVPLNYKNPVDRNRTIIEEAGLKTVISSRALNWNLKGVKVLQIGDEMQASAEELYLPQLNADSLAYLFFTSGSTGKPKGVPVSHAHLNAFLENVISNENYDFKSSDRFLQMFELTFDLSVFSFFVPLCVGACCCIIPEQGIQYLQVIKTLEEQNITVALMVPSILNYLQPYFDEITLPALRYSLFCGEALYENLTSQWSTCVPHAIIENVYGPTEATIFFTRYAWNDLSKNEAVNGILPIGKPMHGLDAVIVDEKNKKIDDGMTGELCLLGNQVVKEYWNNKEKTRDAFIHIEGYSTPAYKTGDLCFINENENLVYCGRADNQVKIDGFRVELGEIEYFAKQFSGCDNVAAVAIAGENGNYSIYLFIETKQLVNDLNALLKQKLPPYMIPSRIHLIEQMPYNLNGKIDRNKLKEIAGSQSVIR